MVFVGAEEEGLRGIVGPKHQNDQRAGRTIGRTGRRATEIDPDERLSDREENGCDKCAQYEVGPGYRRVGQDLVDRCEQ